MDVEVLPGFCQICHYSLCSSSPVDLEIELRSLLLFIRPARCRHVDFVSFWLQGKTSLDLILKRLRCKIDLSLCNNCKRHDHVLYQSILEDESGYVGQVKFETYKSRKLNQFYLCRRCKHLKKHPLKIGSFNVEFLRNYFYMRFLHDVIIFT